MTICAADRCSRKADPSTECSYCEKSFCKECAAAQEDGCPNAACVLNLSSDSEGSSDGEFDRIRVDEEELVRQQA